jgi:hypothetical protein
MKITKGNFPKGMKKVIPKMKQAEKKSIFMSSGRRKEIIKGQAHFDKTKNLPTI